MEELCDMDNRVEKCFAKLVNNNVLIKDDGFKAILTTTQQIYYDLKYITETLKKLDKVEDAKNDWKYESF